MNIFTADGFLDALARRQLLNFIPDRLYLKIRYRAKLGIRLNLDNPQTFQEKQQWLKLHDRKESYSDYADKYFVKKIVAERIGEEYVIPTVGGPWDSFGEINFDSLPEQFVLKVNHDSGGTVICRDKAGFDLDAAERKLTKSLR